MLQADETILDPYNHSGLHRGIYAEDEDHFGFIDNVVLRPLIERFTTVSAQEWAQLKALFDKVRILMDARAPNNVVEHSASALRWQVAFACLLLC